MFSLINCNLMFFLHFENFDCLDALKTGCKLKNRLMRVSLNSLLLSLSPPHPIFSRDASCWIFFFHVLKIEFDFHFFLFLIALVVQRAKCFLLTIYFHHFTLQSSMSINFCNNALVTNSSFTLMLRIHVAMMNEMIKLNFISSLFNFYLT